MVDELRSFQDVFRDVPLSPKLAEALQNAQVGRVKLLKAEKVLCVDMELPRIVDERCFPALEKQLLSRFPIVTSVRINRRYVLAETDTMKRLAAYRDNLLYEVERISPICSRVLENSNWQMDGGKLYIDIKHNSAFLFTRRNVHRAMETILQERLQIDTTIVLREEKAKAEDIAKKVARMENEAVVTAIRAQEEAPSAPPAPRAPKRVVQPNAPSGAQGNGFQGKRGGGGRKQLRINKELTGVLTRLSEQLETDDEIVIEGIIFGIETRETKTGKYIVSFDMTDKTSSVTVKFFLSKEDFESPDSEFMALVKKGNGIRVYGRVQYDMYSKEINVMANELCPFEMKTEKRQDNAERKRVELHLHTQMSQMDAINPVKDYIKRAADWGHTAIAVTDHGVVQAFPEAMDAAKKNGVKMIYGVEAYIVDDIGVMVTEREGTRGLDTEYVVFDLETTGFSSETCRIIEIGAVKIRGGEIVDRFSTFVDPRQSLPQKIIEITNITDDMLVGAPLIEAVMPDFLAFIGNAVLVAHNAPFDMGFLRSWAKKCGLDADDAASLCTLSLSRALFNTLSSHKLNAVAKHLQVPLTGHHRAVNDAEATAHIFLKCLDILRERGVSQLNELNALARADVDVKKLKYYHAIILVKDLVGLRNLYELISLSHIDYFFKRPRMPKSQIQRLREGLILGTACEAGEVFLAVREGRAEVEVKRIADFYDYLEIQPIGNNMYLHRNGTAESVDVLRDWNKQIVAYGEKWQKPVVATCDVHFMNPEDEVFRRIILASMKFKDADDQPPLYFRTTEEMLAEFDYLGAAKAYEVVVENTNLIADMIEAIKPIPDGTFPPKIPGAEEEIKNIVMKKAHETYGNPLPPVVEARLDRELQSIIKNGFSVMYIIAQKLVWNSVEAGYLVGSRGSVGSSFVATMADITEVNPLPPHYYCPACKYIDFDSDEVRAYAGASGCDMPKKPCPQCGEMLRGEGHDIPFETFLGFDGDKEPDIDLNFSGEYQAKAHAYTEELFGTGYVFKAGTIGTVADKTAYGYVFKYLEERGRMERNAEINRLVSGCTGIKRTTGQHPGGLMIVPDDRSIYEFCPIQRPADKDASDVTTTHFDYHSISGRLLKLDILGHDVPTIIRMLHDMTGVDPRDVDLGDADVMSLFTSPDKLGVTAADINCDTGSLGLPEFGTNFVRKMLMDTKPSSFAELVRISGLSHGTDVWLNNAQELVQNGTATLKEIIPTRDDIMVYLINKGMEKLAAFKIMENVRKGKGLTEKEEELMLVADVPEWYIESCRRIKYMFPKGHAVAYVMMTVRIGYFKIHFPEAFYAASFSVKAEDFDYALMCRGQGAVGAEMKRIHALGKEATMKEKGIVSTLELVYEMYARGISFVPLDLYTASAGKFTLAGEKKLMPPLCSVQGLGLNVAQKIVAAREDGEFLSAEELRIRTDVNKTVVELLRELKILEGIPDTNQLSLF